MSASVLQILLIEDDEDDYVLTRDLLADCEGFRYQLDWVQNYEAGLFGIQQQKHDIYLLDYRLGAYSGLDLFYALEDLTRYAPIILLTGQGDRDVDLAAMAFGAADYLNKNELNTTTLERAIRYSLQQHKIIGALAQSEERFRLLVEHAADALFLHDQQGNIQDANQIACESLGYSREELLRMKITDFERGIPSQQFDHVWKQMTLDKPITLEGLHKHRNGHCFPVEIRSGMFQYANNHLIISLVRDITKRKQSEEKLRQAATVFDNTIEGIMITDPNGHIMQVNKAFCELTGYTASEVIGQNPKLLKSNKHPQTFYQAMWARLLKTGRWRGEIWNHNKQGELFAAWLTISSVKDTQQKISHYVGILFDITARKKAENRLQILANYDSLTELPNRLLFHERLAQAIRYADQSGYKVALLFMDLDRFKYVNDTLGHQVGDDFLKKVATRLREEVGKQGIVARLGGDEFTIIIEKVSSNKQVAQLAKHILNSFNQPFRLENHEVFINASIGISLYPDDGENIDTLLKNADAAMYKAKAHGCGHYQFFTEELAQHARRQLSLEYSLRRALEREELDIYYQPQIALTTGKIIGTEALLRWRHPQFGLLSPDKFIPIAEETGLIIPIGEWVLYTACQQNRKWLAAGLPCLDIAVNLSGLQFKENYTLKMVEQTLTETGLPHECLELELTETHVMRDPTLTCQILNALRDMGVHIAIDDFGTGYSSLSHLKRFPINKLKIDRMFVKDVLTDVDDAAIVTAVIAMAHSMNLRVLAEGVETIGQLQFLREQHCDEVQGHYCSVAVTANEVVYLLREKFPTAVALG